MVDGEKNFEREQNFGERTLRENFYFCVGQLRAAYSGLIHDDQPDEIIEDAIAGINKLGGEIVCLAMQERNAGGLNYSVRDTILMEHEGFIENMYRGIGRKEEIRFFDFWG